MPIEQISYNSAALDAELKWLEEVIEARFSLHLGLTTLRRSVYECTPPDLSKDIHSGLSQLVYRLGLGFEERILVILALAPYVRPQSLDMFFTRNDKHDRTFSEVGGIKGRYHSGFLPTLETAVFLLAGKDISKKTQLLDLISPEHALIKLNVLQLHRLEEREPIYSAALELTEEFFTFLTSSKNYKPLWNGSFSAKLISTKLNFSDLFVDKTTLFELQKISAWVAHENFLLNDLNLKRHINAGYKALFYGPSGTGKTLAASLLGKKLGYDVYKIDISQLNSKYIGETNKLIAALFDKAANKNWILFFDEAESLFGMRSKNSDSVGSFYHNETVGYLLQRIESYDGLLIVATNLVEIIDQAFMRRFQALVHFPYPSAEIQSQIWKNVFQDGYPLSPAIDFEQIAQSYQLTGANITNILQEVNLLTVQRLANVISSELLTECIVRELKKSEKNQLKIGF